MTLEELQNKLISAGIEEPEAKKEVSILVKEFNDLNKISQIVNERIKTRKPLQYLLGKAWFMDFEVEVNEKVLIPRSETEILVEETIRRGVACYASTPMMVLDIGTGSGIIAIALAKRIPDIKIFAIDIEKEIIDLAQENAKKNHVNNKISFKICDLFSESASRLFAENKFDLVISNPPYIKENEIKKLKPEIYVHEPKTALVGTKENKTGLIYYERIIELCRRDVARYIPTMLAFEIDPPLVNDLKAILKKEKLNNFEIVKDYNKLDRCLFIYKD